MSGKSKRSLKRAVKKQFVEDPPKQAEGLGPDTAGQSGDLQGLSRVVDADSESVEELIEEGQALEAEAISGVQDARDADESEVRVHERPEDDLHEEYRERDRD
jgi:hypothetical protein